MAWPCPASTARSSMRGRGTRRALGPEPLPRLLLLLLLLRPPPIVAHVIKAAPPAKAPAAFPVPFPCAAPAAFIVVPVPAGLIVVSVPAALPIALAPPTPAVVLPVSGAFVVPPVSTQVPSAGVRSFSPWAAIPGGRAVAAHRGGGQGLPRVARAAHSRGRRPGGRGGARARERAWSGPPGRRSPSIHPNASPSLLLPLPWDPLC